MLGVLRVVDPKRKGVSLSPRRRECSVDLECSVLVLEDKTFEAVDNIRQLYDFVAVLDDTELYA